MATVYEDPHTRCDAPVEGSRRPGVADPAHEDEPGAYLVVDDRSQPEFGVDRSKGRQGSTHHKPMPARSSRESTGMAPFFVATRAA